jgi:hypothetical protein
MIKYAEFIKEKITEWKVAVDTITKAFKKATNTLGNAGRSIKRIIINKI